MSLEQFPGIGQDSEEKLREVSPSHYIFGTEAQAVVARKQWKSAMRVYPIRQFFWKIQDRIESAIESAGNMFKRP